MDERKIEFEFLGEKHELTLSVSATKSIIKEFGGLHELGEKIFDVKNFDIAIDALTKVLKILLSESVIRHNILNPNEQRKEIPEKDFEVIVTLEDLMSLRDILPSLIAKGMKRNVESEENPKKAKTA
jgi:hypothetical protein